MASNVVAGYIFYVVIELIPRKAKERKALKILMQLSRLEHSLAELLGVLEGLVEIDANNRVFFSLKEEYFVVGDIIFKEKISKFILQYSKKIQSELTKIIQLPFFRDLEESKAEIITEFRTSEIFSLKLKSIAENDDIGQNKFSYYDIQNSLNRIITLYIKLFKKEIKKSRMATDDEISTYNQRVELQHNDYSKDKKIFSYINGVGVRVL